MSRRSPDDSAAAVTSRTVEGSSSLCCRHHNGDGGEEDHLADDLAKKLNLHKSPSSSSSDPKQAQQPPNGISSRPHEHNGTRKKSSRSKDKRSSQASAPVIPGNDTRTAESLPSLPSEIPVPQESMSDASKVQPVQCEQQCDAISAAKEAEPQEASSSKTARDPAPSSEGDESPVEYVVYKSELQMPDIMRLIQKDLSEPYSIYTYRYFIHNWPDLCIMARVDDECVGAIVCKLDYHKKVVKRGYIAMLAVDGRFRKRKIGSTLVRKAIDAMIAQDADEVVLETEITNKPALRLYENLGFVRDKRLFRYYLNGVDALRLKLWFR